MALTRMKRRRPRERGMPLTRIKRGRPKERGMPLIRLKKRRPRERGVHLIQMKRSRSRERSMPLIPKKRRELNKRGTVSAALKFCLSDDVHTKGHCFLERQLKYCIMHQDNYMKENAKCTLQLNNTARYSLHEPKQETKELYVKAMKKTITSVVSLRCKLIVAFRSSRKALAEKSRLASKLTNAVLNIAVSKFLNQVLKKGKQIVGEFLACFHSVNVLTISGDDFRECYHRALSERYFYDKSYTLVKYDFPIAIDSNGRCVIALEVGDRHEETNRPNKWRCTSECKGSYITSEEKKSIVDLKALFQQHVCK